MPYRDNDFDWEDVEGKISLICRRFQNLKPWHEDLAQVLRIHAYYVSTDYYNLLRKAIDFWRDVQTKQIPEIPYYDLEVLGNIAKPEDSYYEYDHIISLVEEELNRPGFNKWDNDMIEVSKLLLSIIKGDIDPRIKTTDTYTKSSLNHYFNQRLNLTWVSEETGISYKRLVNSMKNLEDIIRGLALMHKIDIPEEFLTDYYK